MELKTVVLPGGGIGIEIRDASLALLEAPQQRFGLRLHRDLDQALEILGEAAVARQPGEAALDHPAPRQDGEARAAAGRLTISSRNRSAAAAAAATAPWSPPSANRWASQGKRRLSRAQTRARPSRSWMPAG
jgi:hypothetical protein